MTGSGPASFSSLSRRFRYSYDSSTVSRAAHFGSVWSAQRKMCRRYFSSPRAAATVCRSLGILEFSREKRICPGKPGQVVIETIVIEKIISGGQTGADRAALDFARAHGIPHGGWCPRGRRAEDGPIDSRYHLAETPDADPAQRTDWNVRDADATVIFSIAPDLAGGSRKTAESALSHRKPCLHLSRQRDGEAAVGRLRKFLEQHSVRTLNVAGPRQSEEPEVAVFTQAVLEEFWSSHSIPPATRSDSPPSPGRTRRCGSR